MIFIIDGYNIIHALGHLEKSPGAGLKAARERFILDCCRLRQTRGDVEEIRIVFDGTSDLYPSEENYRPGIRIVYTRTQEDADDRIIEILRNRKKPSPVTVVTNDNYVANHSRSLGAQVLSAAGFQSLMAGSRQSGRKKDPKALSRPALSERDAQRITAEYKNILGID